MVMTKIFLLISFAYVGYASQIAELKCWTQRNRTHYLGFFGLRISKDIDDTVECVRKCREHDYCWAVDIDTATRPNCWYQQSDKFKANRLALVPKWSSTNYLYEPKCGELTSGVDLSCWTVTTSSHIFGLTQLDKSTLTDCLAECKRRDDCWTVDWDTMFTPSCWIQTKPMEVSTKKLWWQVTSTNFILDRECSRLVSGVDLKYWLVSELMTYGEPGLVEVQKHDLKSCLGFCMSNKFCTMVEFDPSAAMPCRAQTTPFQVKRGKLVASPSTYNFYLQRDEYEKSLEYVVGEESSCWFYQNDTGYYGRELLELPGANSLEECLEDCRHRPTCIAALYDPSRERPCSFVQGNGALDRGNLREQAGSTIYVPNRECSYWEDERK